jgi:hypothetical protein
MLPVGVELPGNFESAGEWLADAQAMEAAGAEALLVAGGSLDRQALLAALAAVTRSAAIVAPDASPTVELLARGRLRTEEAERWQRVPEPESRAHWRELHEQAEEAGAIGVIVPFGPRLLDLLRNDDVEDDRSDLQLAQG